MSPTLSLIIENGSFIAIFIICLYGAYSSYRRSTSMPGAQIIFFGFALYAIYGLLAFTVPGFNGSLLDSYARLGKPSVATIGFFVTIPLRLGMILVIVGLLRTGRSLKA